MNSSTLIAIAVCLALCTGSLASAVASQPSLATDEEPGVMRRLQGVLLDVHINDHDVLKKTAHAAEAVNHAVATKVKGVQHVATKVGKEAAEGVQDSLKADKKALGKVAEATHKSLAASGKAIAATGTAIKTGVANIITAPFGGLPHAAHKTAEHAQHETKHAVKTAAKGVKKVTHAVAHAVDEKADALHDTAKAAQHAVKKASIKSSIAARLAAMKVTKAVGAGVKAVVKP